MLFCLAMETQKLSFESLRRTFWKKNKGSETLGRRKLKKNLSFWHHNENFDSISSNLVDFYKKPFSLGFFVPVFGQKTRISPRQNAITMIGTEQNTRKTQLNTSITAFHIFYGLSDITEKLGRKRQNMKSNMYDCSECLWLWGWTVTSRGKIGVHVLSDLKMLFFQNNKKITYFKNLISFWSFRSFRKNASGNEIS